MPPRRDPPVDFIADLARRLASVGRRAPVPRAASPVPRHGRKSDDRAAQRNASARRELARALNLVPDYIRQLAKRGMPVSSADAARAWRAVHVPRGKIAAR